MERGQNLAQARQSFLNAGYNPQEIEGAIRKMGGVSHVMVTGENPLPLPVTPLPGARIFPNQIPVNQQAPSQQKKPTKLIIIISAVILGLALLLGLFWNTLFGS